FGRAGAQRRRLRRRRRRGRGGAPRRRHSTPPDRRVTAIAIVGRACVLPGAHSPEALWRAVVEGRDLVGAAPAGRWNVDAERVLARGEESTIDKTWSDRAGYVTGFDFDPTGFALSPERLAGLDPVYLWVLHCARAALRGARLGRTGAVFGNL